MTDTIIGRTVRRTILTDDPDDRVRSIKNYQVYRGISPSTANRLELRVRELEDALEVERELRLRAERAFTELSFEANGLSEKLDEADGFTATQLEVLRRRDQEILKLKKELELVAMQHETQESGLKKRHQEAIKLLMEQLENIGKNKNKNEQDIQQLNIEIDLLNSQNDSANKARSLVEGKLEAYDDQLRRLKAQNEELSRQNNDLQNLKVKNGQEISDLRRQLQELESNHAHVLKLKSQLQSQVDELKSQLEDESRLRAQLQSQLSHLQSEFDSLTVRYEEILSDNGNLKAQIQQTLNDFNLIKHKYDSEVTVRAEEIEDLRRKSGGRILELEELIEQTRHRAANLEKEKIKLQIEIRDYTSQLETVNANNLELGRRLKGSEGSSFDLQKKVDELQLQLTSITGDNDRNVAELIKLRGLVSELTDKNGTLGRENKHLQDNLKDASNQVNDLTRQVQELLLIKSQLLAERDSLALELAELKENHKDLLSKLESANLNLSHLKSELEKRLKEKDDELENLRLNGQRAIDDLQRISTENELRFKSEISRLKKKYETDVKDLELQLAELQRLGLELQKNNKILSNRVKELELLLEEERKALEEARLAAGNWERKWISIKGEYENLLAQLEISERARKLAESQSSDSGGKINELTININNLNNERKRIEGEYNSLRVDYEGHMTGRKMAEERADKLQVELVRLQDELRHEQETGRASENGRKNLEVEIKELRLKIQDLESNGAKEANALVAKLQLRVTEFEHELEAERRRGRDLIAENRKLQRINQEIKTKLEEKNRILHEMSDKINELMAKNKALKRQIEEVEEVVGITIGKYRKGQMQLEEAERRADTVERQSTSIQRALSPLRVVAPHVPITKALITPVSRASGFIRSASVAPLLPRALSVSREVRRMRV